jgi:ribosomal-protein-serine acetyltransferase
MRPTALPAVIQTPRLSLKSHVEDKAQAMFDIIDANRQHLQYMPWEPKTKSVDDVLTYIKTTFAGRKDCSMFDYSIFLGEQYCGNIGLHSIKWYHHRAEIGYWLVSSIEGKGVMSEAVTALEAAAFEAGIQRLEIRCSEDNLKSSQVALRNRYRMEATLRGDQWERGQFRNTLVFGKLLHEHAKHRNELFIRRATPLDAQQIHLVHMRSIQEVCAKDYRPDQIQAWGGRAFDLEKWQQRIAEHFVWVIAEQNSIRGIAHVQLVDADAAVAEMQALYFAPEILGKGFGKLLIEKIFDWAKEMHLKKLVLNSTKTALGFYQKMGFTQGACESKLFMLGGVGIDCHPMEMTFANAE